MATLTLAGSLSLSPGTAVSSGTAVAPSYNGTFSLYEKTSPAECLAGGPVPVSGTTAVSMGSVTTASQFFIKCYSGSVEVRITSGAGTAQAFPLGPLGQWYISGTAITAITLVGTGTVEYLIAGS